MVKKETSANPELYEKWNGDYYGKYQIHRKYLKSVYGLSENATEAEQDAAVSKRFKENSSKFKESADVHLFHFYPYALEQKNKGNYTYELGSENKTFWTKKEGGGWIQSSATDKNAIPYTKLLALQNGIKDYDGDNKITILDWMRQHKERT